MLDKNKLISLLDLISEKGREFVLVFEQALIGEAALQARDGQTPTEWQVCSIISAFINYIAEAERCRYGHFACDLESKNNTQRFVEAANVLGRMGLFWKCWDVGGALSDAKKEHVAKFIENESKIIEHLKSRPDPYDIDVDPLDVRNWMMKLRVLGDVEARLLIEARDLRDDGDGAGSGQGQ